MRDRVQHENLIDITYPTIEYPGNWDEIKLNWQEGKQIHLWLEHKNEVIKRWLQVIEGISPDQEINILSYDNDGGDPYIGKYTAKKFKEDLESASKNMDSPAGKLLVANGNYDLMSEYGEVKIQIVTPEIQAAEQKEALNWEIYEHLQRTGVEIRNVFHDEHGYVKITPLELLEISKKITEYLESNRQKIDTALKNES